MRIILTLLIVLLCTELQAETLQGLITKLRYRAGEFSAVTSAITDSAGEIYLNLAQGPVVRLGGLIKKSVDITYTEADSLGTILPADFRYEEGAMYRPGVDWEVMMPNPLFAIDTSIPSYFIGWQKSDTARFYARRMYEGQLIRVFYRGTAASLDSLTGVSDLTYDLEPLVISEAFGYHLEAQKQFEAAQAIRNQVRKDLGIMKQAGQQ